MHGLSKAKEIVEILAFFFSVSVPNLVWSRRCNDFYKTTTRTIHMRPFDENDDRHVYNLIHEFAHHLAYARNPKGYPAISWSYYSGASRSWHGKAYQDTLVEVIRAWGQKFMECKDYSTVEMAIRSKVREFCPSFFRDIDKYRVGEMVWIIDEGVRVEVKIVSIRRKARRLIVRLSDGTRYQISIQAIVH